MLCTGFEIFQVSHVIRIDETSNWTRHVKTVLSKISRYVGIMHKIKKFLPLKARLQIYHSFVQSHLSFFPKFKDFAPNLTLTQFFRNRRRGCML